MAGNKEGGTKAAVTIKKRYGKNFYARIGAIGGRIGTTGGFATRTACECDIIPGLHHKAQCAGKIGGMKSKRRKQTVAHSK